jgi:hypothetical protein
MGLEVQPMKGSCKATPTLSQPAQVPLPSAAQQRIPQSQAVAGQNTVAWVWLGSPTHRYPHTALGSTVHAASVHAIVRPLDGPWREVAYELPLHRVFEDRVPRLVDLDQDGQDEILLIEADALRGASLVVLKVSPDQQLVEWARGPYAGSTFRWLNPAGVADFDGDGQLDIASVTTPHIGGTLILHHVQPPHLLPFAKTMDVSNHRMGALEQDLAVIVQLGSARAMERTGRPDAHAGPYRPPHADAGRCVRHSIQRHGPSGHADPLNRGLFRLPSAPAFAALPATVARPCHPDRPPGRSAFRARAQCRQSPGCCAPATSRCGP